jgi:hypothetical protein
MIEVADILRRHGPDYQRQHPLLPSQQKALEDLVRCRTAACGGHLYQCDRCGYQHYSYHSCGNRHCPKCHTHQTERWLEDHHQDLLPCPYYLLTFTLPAELRPLVQAHQRDLYGLLLSSAAAAVQKLAWDPRYVGGQLAILGVLHTWTRALLYHPHAHLLVSAGGLSPDGQQWQPARNPAFLVPGFALSRIFRGKFKAGLKSLGLLDQAPPAAWDKKWVVHCQPAGSGQKVLEYLGRYVFRTAIANSRLDAFENGQVRFHYTDNRTHQTRQVDLRAEEFIRRFLLHTLPKGFVKVRTYGLWSAQGQARLEIARAHVVPAPAPPPALPWLPDPEELPLPPAAEPPPEPESLCPQCHCGHLVWVRRLRAHRARAP